MPDHVTLTVVLPNYNHGSLIPRALTALLSQDRRPDEIIVVDDASTDDSADVLASFAARAPSLRVLVNRKNEGAIAALTRGYQAARGQLIYFAAADDWVMPGFFTLAIEALEAHPDLGLFCGEAVLVDGRTKERIGFRPAIRPIRRAGAIPPQDVKRLLRRSDNWILTGSSVFRRDAVAWAGGLDARLGSFADGFLARKIALSFGFYFAPQVVATWAIFSDSVSRKTALDTAQATRALAVVPERIAADPVFPKWYAGVFQNRWRFATSRLALEARPIDFDLLATMGGRSALDRAVLARLCPHLGRNLARLTALAWLWFRLRPMSLAGVVRSVLARRLQAFRANAIASA